VPICALRNPVDRRRSALLFCVTYRHLSLVRFRVFTVYPTRGSGCVVHALSLARLRRTAFHFPFVAALSRSPPLDLGCVDDMSTTRHT
jgi:hypothetical protein